MRILVVDDDPIQRGLLERQFDKVGVEVVMAKSGNEGWAVVQRRPLDAVITDLLMIDGDGTDLLRQVHALPLAIRPYMVVYSAFGDDELRDFMVASGADECLQKPARLADIRSLIDHIEAKRPRRVIEA